MSNPIVFKGVYPIGETDTSALPVKDVNSAVGYYTQVLGFSVVSRGKDKAVLRRDEVTIGLAVNGANPDDASCYFDVQNVEALRDELDDKGIAPTPFRKDRHEKGYNKIFFAKEPYGVCFCFGRQTTEED